MPLFQSFKLANETPSVQQFFTLPLRNDKHAVHNRNAGVMHSIDAKHGRNAAYGARDRRHGEAAS